MLEEASILRFESIDTHVDPNICFDQNLGESLAHPRKYTQLISKLIYLTVTLFDIIFVGAVLSRYMQSPFKLHWTAACHILRYVK